MAKKAKKKSAKPHKPTDATLRNVRAANKRIAALEARMSAVEAKL